MGSVNDSNDIFDPYTIDPARFDPRVNQFGIPRRVIIELYEDLLWRFRETTRTALYEAATRLACDQVSWIKECEGEIVWPQHLFTTSDQRSL